jgi:hypothetical protein
MERPPHFLRAWEVSVFLLALVPFCYVGLLKFVPGTPVFGFKFVVGYAVVLFVVLIFGGWVYMSHRMRKRVFSPGGVGKGAESKNRPAEDRIDLDLQEAFASLKQTHARATGITILISAALFFFFLHEFWNVLNLRNAIFLGLGIFLFVWVIVWVKGFADRKAIALAERYGTKFFVSSQGIRVPCFVFCDPAIIRLGEKDLAYLDIPWSQVVEFSVRPGREPDGGHFLIGVNGSLVLFADSRARLFEMSAPFVGLHRRYFQGKESQILKVVSRYLAQEKWNVRDELRG